MLVYYILYAILTLVSLKGGGRGLGSWPKMKPKSAYSMNSHYNRILTNTNTASCVGIYYEIFVHSYAYNKIQCVIYYAYTRRNRMYTYTMYSC